MNLSVIKENNPSESRTALSPQAAKKLKKLSVTVQVEMGAGDRAGFADSDYREAGCEIVTTQQALAGDIILGVNRPSTDQLKNLKSGALLLSLFEPYNAKAELALCAEKKVDVI